MARTLTLTFTVGFTDERSATVSGTTIVSDPEYRYVPAQYVDAGE